MKKMLLFALLFALLPVFLHAQADFATGLHATRTGLEHWYSSGLFHLTGIPFSNLGCKGCHGPSNADGSSYQGSYAPSCVDCHPSGTFDKNALVQEQCLGCHVRQKTEIDLPGYSDVHRSAGLKCWDCHRASEIHGDGSPYLSLLDTGAIKTDCSDCHSSLPARHANNDPHNGALHCTACHTETVISCYSCHFESQVDAGKDRAFRTIDGFIFLLNRAKDGKVGTGTFQSITYAGKSFVAFAPSHSHIITGSGRRCVACHQNLGGKVPAIEQYNNTARIKIASWNSSDSSLDWIRGVIPLPVDYMTTVSMDFLSYNGSTTDPVVSTKNWSLVSGSWDAQHLLFGTPLTREQMTRLGFALTDAGSTAQPLDLNLWEITPHPVTGPATIKFRLPAQATVSLKLYDQRGRIVRTLSSSVQEAGVHTWTYELSGLPAGLYYCVLIAGQQQRVRKMLVLR